MVTKISKLICGVLLLLLSVNIYAKQTPEVFLREITGDLLTALDKNSKAIKQDEQSLYHFVDKFILPHIDFVEMGQWIAGRTAWGRATDVEREAFIKEFKVLVVNTYASALHKYTSEKIIIDPYKGNLQAKRLQVTSNVIRADGTKVQVNYRLIATDDAWKVYDLIVEGVSLLQGFQAQFGDDIRLHGLSWVSKKIQSHNRGA